MAGLHNIVTIDFETLPIAPRPKYPPPAVGVAIKRGSEPARYYAFGHPIDNNATYEDAAAAILEVASSDAELLFHNAKLDLDVLEDSFGIVIAPSRVHDTMIMLFLTDPRAETYSLKATAERLLGLPPGERDVVVDWLLAQKVVAGARMTAKRAPAYIGYAPGSIVEPYAIGDVDRTYKIACMIWPQINASRMMTAYDRERKLLPCIRDMERNGLRVDVSALATDIARCEQDLTRIEQYLRDRLNTPELNINSGRGLVAALVACGLADEETLGKTPSGEIKSDKKSIEKGVSDTIVVAMLRHHGALSTCLKTFMLPWYRIASASGGFIYTTWHTTRTDEYGARTGRMSGTPNFMNIPKSFPALWRHEKEGLPMCPITLGVIPNVRKYVVPYQLGDGFIDRDYSAQEPRLLAHFERGALLEEYCRDPWSDFHDIVREALEREMGEPVTRKAAKAINLGIIYGQGIQLLSKNMAVSEDKAKIMRDSVLRLYPGLSKLQQAMRDRAKKKQPIRTWGGRLYYCEPTEWIDGKRKSYEYKLVNVLIQGSAADVTKEAIIRFYAVKKPHWRLVLAVHDELVVSAPTAELAEAMTVLKNTMESIETMVPMLSEGKISNKSWGDLLDYDKKGKLVGSTRTDV